ncbi:MAG: YegP family protein [Acidobacteriota bacterium]
MGAKFEKYTDEAGEYRFRYYGNSGGQILRSEGYVRTSGRDNGIRSVKDNAPYDSTYDLKMSADYRYYFNMVASNTEIIATSMLYSSTTDRAEAISDVKVYAPSAPIT